VSTNTYPPDELPATALAPELVVEIYGTHRNYVRLVTRKTIDLIRDGWVTPNDGLQIITEALSTRDLFR
jgi:hypothetical protein